MGFQRQHAINSLDHRWHLGPDNRDRRRTRRIYRPGHTNLLSSDSRGELRSSDNCGYRTGNRNRDSNDDGSCGFATGSNMDSNNVSAPGLLPLAGFESGICFLRSPAHSNAAKFGGSNPAIGVGAKDSPADGNLSRVSGCENLDFRSEQI